MACKARPPIAWKIGAKSACALRFVKVAMAQQDCLAHDSRKSRTFTPPSGCVLMSLCSRLHYRSRRCDDRSMVKFVRVMLMLLAALFVARGSVAYDSQAASYHVHLSHMEMALHRGHAPMDGHQIEAQCSKAGCMLAACQAQSVTAAILPHGPFAVPPLLSPSYNLPDDTAFSSLRKEPPSPPPKSPIGYLQAA